MQSIKEREAFALRLKEALRRVGDDGTSPTRLAREFNRRYGGETITLHAARKWLQGEALPAQDKLRALAGWLGVSSEWLRFGDGEHRTAVYRVEDSSGSADLALAREIASLSPAHQDAVRALVKALKRAEKGG